MLARLRTQALISGMIKRHSKLSCCTDHLRVPFPRRYATAGRKEGHPQQQEEHAANSREGATVGPPGICGDDESGREYGESEFPPAERYRGVQPYEEGERTPGQQADGRAYGTTARPSHAEERPSGDVHA